MNNSDEFIYYNESIEWMLKNIIDMSKIILNDFERNGKTHPVYILEKLGRAKNDLDILVEMSREKIKENEKRS